MRLKACWDWDFLRNDLGDPAAPARSRPDRQAGDRTTSCLLLARARYPETDREMRNSAAPDRCREAPDDQDRKEEASDQRGSGRGTVAHRVSRYRRPRERARLRVSP